MALRKVLIGDVCRIYSGGDAPQIISDKKTADCPIPVYSNGLQDEGLYGYTNEAQIEGDVVSLTARGANSGVVFYRKEPFLPIVRLISIIPDRTRINSRYLYYLLKTKVFLASKTGAAQPQITIPAVAREEISYEIDIRTQIRIADILSTYDNLIENNQKQIKLLEETAQRLYKEWFIDLRFPGHETTKIKNGVPEGWTCKFVDDFGTVVTGKTPSTSKDDNYGGNIPFVTIPDMHGNVFSLKTERYLTKKGADSQKVKYLPKNSVIVSCIATVGLVNIASEECQTNQQINSVILENERDLYFFYESMLRIKSLLDGVGSNGATMTNVNKSKFGNIKVIYPTKYLVEKYYNFCKPIFDKILSLSKTGIQLKDARDRLLPKLMSGEIEV